MMGEEAPSSALNCYYNHYHAQMWSFTFIVNWAVVCKSVFVPYKLSLSSVPAGDDCALMLVWAEGQC